MKEKIYTAIFRLLFVMVLLALTLTACGTKQADITPTEQSIVVETPLVTPQVPTSSIPDELYPSFIPLITKPDILSTDQMAFMYGFTVFIFNQNKDAFEKLNPKGFGELRSISWSSDGKTLAMVGIGGTTSIESNIYVVDSNGNNFHPLVPEPMPYLMGVNWSHDGKRLVAWSIEDVTVLYLVNSDGTGLTKIKLDRQVFGKPQFAPDDASLYLVGANESSSGLFQVGLDGSLTRQVSGLVTNVEAFAWSADGSRLACIEVDRDKKETRLTIENTNGSKKITAATFPFSELNGDGNTLNFEWTPDGKYILFDIELGFDDYAIYAANADGTGARKLIESARIPSISADGKWLAYIGLEKKVPPKLLIADLISALASTDPITPIVVSELPAKRNGFKELDKILWMP